MILPGREPLWRGDARRRVRTVGARPLFPDRLEDAYRRDLQRRYLAAHKLLMQRLAPVIARIRPDMNARAAERRDNARDDLSSLLRVLDEVERSFKATYKPDKETLEATAGKVDQYASREVARTIQSVAGIDVTRGGALEDLYHRWAQENVELIKSLDAKHFSTIRDAVKDAVRDGRTTRALMDELQTRYGITKRHAELIARDQIGTLNAKVTQERQTSLGVTKYIWMTVGDERVRGRPGGLYPDARPSHWDRDGKEFYWSQPPSDGHPGEPIQCFPGRTLIGNAGPSGSPIDGLTVHAAFRRLYGGSVVRILAEDGEVTCTPNHPFMTGRGWVPAQSIAVGDTVFRSSCRDQIAASDVYNAFANRPNVLPLVRPGNSDDFHGDGDPAHETESVVYGGPSGVRPITVRPYEPFDWHPTSVIAVERVTPPEPLWVYNFATALGWYVANGFVVSNCRCVAVAVLD